MAKFSINGLDEISVSFEELADITPDEKIGVLMAGARIIQSAHVKKILEVFRERTGALAKSIKILPRTTRQEPYILITPTGKHPGSGTGKRMKRIKGNRRISSGNYSGTNAEVAYVLEYGSPRIAPTHWMETANEEAEDEAFEAMQTAWDELVEKKLGNK